MELDTLLPFNVKGHTLLRYPGRRVSGSAFPAKLDTGNAKYAPARSFLPASSTGARARAWMAEGRRASAMPSLSPPYRDAPAGGQLGRHDEGNVSTIWHLRTPRAARAKGQ
jgi:hypothetical protein